MALASGSALLIEQREAIQIVTINRPRQRNALTLQAWCDLAAAVKAFEEHERLKLLILRGAGEQAFAAGSDIRELPSVYADPDTGADYDATLLNTQKQLAACSKPTIAMIHGHCSGGGLGLATACDLRLAASTAVFAAPPAKLGLVYGVSATHRLMQLIGPARTRELLMTARSVSAAEAFTLGLVNQVFDAKELEPETLRVAHRICSNSQFSVRAGKRIVRRILAGEHDDDEHYFSLVRESVQGPDFTEGLAAFLAKRAPDFPAN